MLWPDLIHAKALFQTKAPKGWRSPKRFASATP
jgi:hypothetical protein